MYQYFIRITLHTPALPSGRGASLENLSAAASGAATSLVDEVASGLIGTPREVKSNELDWAGWAEISTGAAPFLKLGRVKKNLYYDNATTMMVRQISTDKTELE